MAGANAASQKAPALRVLMLAGDSPSSRMMFHALSPSVDLVAVVMEEPVPARLLLGRRVTKLGWVRVAGQVAFLLYGKVLARQARARIEVLRERFGLSEAAIPEARLRRVRSVNDPEVMALIRDIRPDAILVNGTRIISKAVLACTTAPFLNTHAGMTPRYRGVHGGYWALARGDRAHCGVTVHLVDAGIDTGGVLYQARIEPEAEDSFHSYPIHQIAAAVPLMKRALEDVRQGTLQVTEGVGPSQLWSHPTLLEYLAFRQAGVK